MFPIRKKQTNNQPTSISNSVASSSGVEGYAAGTDSAGTDSISFDGPQHVECPTCIDPPGDGDPTVCTPSDDYTLSATLNNTTVSTISDDIPTWRLAPFWGGIIQEVEGQLANFEQDYTSKYQDAPYHQTFDLDYRATLNTTLMPNGQLSFSLTLYDMFSRVYFSSTVGYLSNARIKISANSIEFNGIYTIASDNFSITGIEFENLDADVNSDTSFGPILDFVAYLIRTVAGVNNSQIAGEIEDAITNNVMASIDEVNRNSPNMFVRSLLDFPELDNILPLLDQAITDLLQDDVSATLEVALPSCGDIDRDGLIDLDVSTN